MEKDIKASISVLDCFQSMFYCYGAAHQFDRYYKDGKFDGCERKREELSLCVKIQFAGPEETRQLAKQLLQPENPTEGKIWPVRSIPLPPLPAAPAAAAAAAGGASAAENQR